MIILFHSLQPHALHFTMVLYDHRSLRKRHYTHHMRNMPHTVLQVFVIIYRRTGYPVRFQRIEVRNMHMTGKTVQFLLYRIFKPRRYRQRQYHHRCAQARGYHPDTYYKGETALLPGKVPTRYKQGKIQNGSKIWYIKREPFRPGSLSQYIMIFFAFNFNSARV